MVWEIIEKRISEREVQTSGGGGGTVGHNKREARISNKRRDKRFNVESKGSCPNWE